MYLKSRGSIEKSFQSCFLKSPKIQFTNTFRYAEVMKSLLNEKFGYLLATLQREVEPDNVVPHSASFDDVKEMFGKNEIPTKILVVLIFV